MALEPAAVRSIEPVLSSAAAVTLSDAESAGVADREIAAVGQRPRQRQARSAVAVVGVEIDVSVIDERAGRRHRGAVFEIERRPGADRSEPRQSAVRPQRRAVLDEGVVSVQAQLRVAGQAGDLPARELDRAVARRVRTLPLQTPAVPNPAPPVSRRGAPGWRWRPVRSIEPVLSSDAAFTSSDAESVALPMWSVRCWSAPPPRSGSIRRCRRRCRDGCLRH